MFENIKKLFKKTNKKDTLSTSSRDTAKERLHLVLMQDRANVSADFLDLMRQEIIEVIKKYIDIDESALDVRLKNQANEDGTQGAPVLYANIPILSIKDENKKNIKEANKLNSSKDTENVEKQSEKEKIEENKEEIKHRIEENNKEIKDNAESRKIEQNKETTKDEANENQENVEKANCEKEKVEVNDTEKEKMAEEIEKQENEKIEEAKKIVQEENSDNEDFEIDNKQE